MVTRTRRAEHKCPRATRVPDRHSPGKDAAWRPWTRLRPSPMAPGGTSLPRPERNGQKARRPPRESRRAGHRQEESGSEARQGPPQGGESRQVGPENRRRTGFREGDVKSSRRQGVLAQTICQIQGQADGNSERETGFQAACRAESGGGRLPHAQDGSRQGSGRQSASDQIVVSPNVRHRIGRKTAGKTIRRGQSAPQA